jgi:hypothetical protein
MKRFVVLVAFFIFVTAEMHSTDIFYLRNLFFEASNSKEKTDYMIKVLSKAEDKSLPIVKGYTAMSYMLLAKHGFNFLARYNNFITGRDLLEKAIAEDRNNVELRFLRLSVQLNVPSILNYSDSIEADKSIVKTQYQFIKDPDLKEKIRSFFTKKNIPLR